MNDHMIKSIMGLLAFMMNRFAAGLSLMAMIVLGVLKVTNVIAWSWWIILTPLLVYGTVSLVIALVFYGSLREAMKDK